MCAYYSDNPLFIVIPDPDRIGVKEITAIFRNDRFYSKNPSFIVIPDPDRGSS